MLDTLMNRVDEGLDMSGAVRHQELDTSEDLESLSSDARGELMKFVALKVPSRHTFTNSNGKKCVVFYDSRGRASDSPIAMMADSDLVRVAVAHGWKPEPTVAEEESTDPGSSMIVPIQAIGAITRDTVNGDEMESINTLKEVFGESPFDSDRAWRAGVKGEQLQQLVDTGIVSISDDGYRLTPRALNIGESSDTSMSVIRDGVSEFWHNGYEILQDTIMDVAATWNVTIDDDSIYRRSDKIISSARGFEMHSRKWRSGLNLFIERNGRVDREKLFADMKAGMEKGKKLLSAIVKLGALVKKTDREQWDMESDNIVLAEKAYDTFTKSGYRLMDAIEKF